MGNRLLFMYSFDQAYQHFMMPFAYFSWVSNRDVNDISYQFITDSRNIGDLSRMLNEFGEMTGCRVMIRKPNCRNARPNTQRFVQSPMTQDFDFCYMGDIDIMILQPIQKFHMDFMERNDIPYSNVRRPGTDRLTGLQFCRREYFQITSTSREMFSERMPLSDEQVLYNVVVNSGMRTIEWDRDVNKRPCHGFHISMNRVPFNKGSKIKITLGKDFLVKLEQVISTQEYLKFRELFFSKKFNGIFQEAIEFVRKSSPSS